MPKKFEILNSTAEFLIFQIEGKEDGVQVVYHNESVWCTQKAMAELFDVGVPAVHEPRNSGNGVRLFCVSLPYADM